MEDFRGDVAQSSLGMTAPFSHLSSADGFDLGPAEGREVVQGGNADMDLGSLAVGIS
ncbi:hypothetical protein FHS00_003431 [Limimaricola variabilis]|uniref:Uncharacterized protein n=1 Tax=Limimaricola variabilis TaxID=1492771 RepID=A0ABR6HTE3_9RHOB|nr:hypothetical protein [Limimaricola variabilis]